MSKLYDEKVNNQKVELLEIILTKEYKYKYSKKKSLKNPQGGSYSLKGDEVRGETPSGLTSRQVIHNCSRCDERPQSAPAL